MSVSPLKQQMSLTAAYIRERVTWPGPQSEQVTSGRNKWESSEAGEIATRLETSGGARRRRSPMEK